MSSLAPIREFLDQKRLAIVGVSQRPNDFSRMLFREFRKRGYEVAPVNPAATEIEGQPCFANVRAVQPPVSSVLVMTPPAVTETVVRDCAASGVQRVWMHRATGAGAVSPEAVRFCEANGISVIPGECPFMFFSGGLIHRMHGLIRKIGGSYPR
jgi:predicted CoA-binding protein